MAFSYLCGIVLSLCVASAVGQGGPLSNLIVPQPSQQQQTVQLANPVTSGQVTPLVNLPTSGQIMNQVPNLPPHHISGPFGTPQQSGQVSQNTWQQRPPQQIQFQQPQQPQQQPTMQNLQTIGQQQQANVAIPPVLGGPLANIAMANRLSNALTPQQQKGMNPLGLLALGAGGSDALFPYMLLSRSGMLNQNPMLSLMVLSNY